jgi:hypothetical protein
VTSVHHIGPGARGRGGPAALHQPLRRGHRRHPLSAAPAASPRPTGAGERGRGGARRARDPLRRARSRESPIPLGPRRQTERAQQLFPPRRDRVGRRRLRSAVRAEDRHGGARQLPGRRPGSPDRDRLRAQRAQPAAARPPAEQDPQRHSYAIDPGRRRGERDRLRRSRGCRASLREGPAQPGSVVVGLDSDGEGRPACDQTVGRDLTHIGRRTSGATPPAAITSSL